MASINQAAFDGSLERVKGRMPEAVRDGIRKFILSADDAHLSGINPFKAASALKLEPMPTLKAFLQLTKEGLFNLDWAVHCPSCKGMTQSARDLASLKHDSSCGFCKVDFKASFDRSVEVSFSVNPGVVRPGEVKPFEALAASLDTLPGIEVELEAGESRRLKFRLKAGNYLFLVPEDGKAFNIVVSDAGASAAPEEAQKFELEYSESLDVLTVVRARSGVGEFTIANRSASKRNITCARMVPPRWPSAALVSSLQEFRDFFSSQMLAHDESFSIESLAFLFTDIKGSTELYQRLGDADAFYLVKEHFYVLEDIVRRHSGGIVKTIGDAIMAVFVDPKDALRSAVEAIEAFDDFAPSSELKDLIVIKAGMHYGPCIAVTLNDRIDYFGTTVNVAARIQGLSDGRDVMASEALYARSEAAAYLAGALWREEPFTTSLKGLAEEYRVFKLDRG